MRFFPWKPELVLNTLWMVVGPKFRLKLTIFTFFGQVFPQKVIFDQKRKKWASTLGFAYSNYSGHQILTYTNNFDFLRQICPKKAFPV